VIVHRFYNIHSALMVVRWQEHLLWLVKTDDRSRPVTPISRHIRRDGVSGWKIVVVCSSISGGWMLRHTWSWHDRGTARLSAFRSLCTGRWENRAHPRHVWCRSLAPAVSANLNWKHWYSSHHVCIHFFCLIFIFNN